MSDFNELVPWIKIYILTKIFNEVALLHEAFKLITEKPDPPQGESE